MDAVTVHTADLQGLDGISVQDERQRLGHLSIWMWRDSNRELQRRQRVISTSSSAPTSRFIAPLMRRSFRFRELCDGAESVKLPRHGVFLAGSDR
jgi:hypothetical protein